MDSLHTAHQTMMKHINNEDDHAPPLPLEILEPFVSEETYDWLYDAEEKERAWKKIQKAMHFFQTKEEASSSPNPVTEDTDKDKKEAPRICRWATSLNDPDGIGHIGVELIKDSITEKEEDLDGSSLELVYILSDHHWQGFGNQLWAASRHVSNHLADADRCRILLGVEPPTMNDDHNRQHPLQGKSFVELGAGAAIPSWTAMWRGARVVMTDQGVPGRIRCAAECAARNWSEVLASSIDTKGSDDENEANTVPGGHHQPRVCAHDWGMPVDPVFQTLKGDNINDNGGEDDQAPKRFDVLVATECCFMPWFYPELLTSIDALLIDQGGVAILAFALHGNVPDEEVWTLLDQAEECGFQVEQLAVQQLTPQSSDMKRQQGLVHTLRLTRKEQPPE